MRGLPRRQLHCRLTRQEVRTGSCIELSRRSSISNISLACSSCCGESGGTSPVVENGRRCLPVQARGPASDDQAVAGVLIHQRRDGFDVRARQQRQRRNDVGVFAPDREAVDGGVVEFPGAAERGNGGVRVGMVYRILRCGLACASMLFSSAWIFSLRSAGAALSRRARTVSMAPESSSCRTAAGRSGRSPSDSAIVSSRSAAASRTAKPRLEKRADRFLASVTRGVPAGHLQHDVGELPR